ncbi:hypothetical protein BC943DRAFT_182953 [Umbelopsis sp. AD052]|nr:hypothetical protein BC943DRAFT_182953 [Umbelopsis sp. AD052]
MGYCKRCGDLNTSAKCRKCGGPVMSRTLHHTGDQPVVDRWKSRYMDSINGSEKLNVDSPSVLSTKGSLSMPTKNINYFQQLRRSSHTTAIAPMPITSTQPFVASTWSNTTGGHCNHCERKIADHSLTLSTGATYHPGCLMCQQCSKTVTDNAFTLLDSKVYHHQCAPTRAHHCNKCSQPFKNVYLNVNHAKYHVECFGCTSCRKALPPSCLYMEMAKSPYCKSCAGSKFADDGSATMKVVPPPVSIMAPVISSDDVKPSSLFTSRARPLPRFGGSKTCPACHQTINLLEEKNGPMASKWHKKCLKCEACSKALDSSAIMKDNGQFTSLVCRSCHYNRVEPTSQQKVGQMV